MRLGVQGLFVILLICHAHSVPWTVATGYGSPIPEFALSRRGKGSEAAVKCSVVKGALNVVSGHEYGVR
jgi:hypothetical protein